MMVNILAALLSILCLRIAHGELCTCMSYLIYENGLSNENKINSIEYEVDGATCDGNGVRKCKNFCVEMYQQLTDNGKTCGLIPNEDRRVADWMCESLARDVCDGRVGVFAQSCGSDPVDTGFRFVENICCKSGYSIHC